MKNKYVAEYVVNRIDLSTTQELVKLLEMIIDTNESLLSNKNIDEIDELIIKITIDDGGEKLKISTKD